MDLLEEIKDLSDELKKTRDELQLMRTEMKEEISSLTSKIQTIKVFDNKKENYINYDRDDFHQNTYSFIKSFKAFSKSVVGLIAFALIILQIINIILNWTK